MATWKQILKHNHMSKVAFDATFGTNNKNVNSSYLLPLTLIYDFLCWSSCIHCFLIGLLFKVLLVHIAYRTWVLESRTWPSSTIVPFIYFDDIWQVAK